MLGCEATRERMSADVDGALPWWGRGLLRFHLAFCRTCPAVQVSLRRTVDGLRRLRDLPAQDEPPGPPASPAP